MKFLLVSESGDGCAIAHRLQAEGHDCVVMIKDPDAAGRGKGLITTTLSAGGWDFVPDRETIVIADCTGSGTILDLLSSSGFAVAGGSALCDRLEMDRRFARGVFDSCQVQTPGSVPFKDWDEARSFVEDQQKKLVFKPSGEASGVIPSFVARSAGEMLEMLDIYAAKMPKSPEFELEQFIEGIDISTEGWWDAQQEKFLLPFNHTLETKKFLNDDLGPSGGCVGNLVWPCANGVGAGAFECPICGATLMKLETYFKEIGLASGPIDVNAIVSSEANDVGSVYALEFTPRLGYDAAPTLLWELLDAPLGEFLSALAGYTEPGKGWKPQLTAEDTMPLRDLYAAGIRLSIKPWPSEEFKAAEGVPLRGLRPDGSGFGQFYFMDLALDEESQQLRSSGGTGIIGVATGASDSVTDAFYSAYKVIRKIKMPELQFRTDLSEYFQKRMAKLNRLLEKATA